MHFFTHAAAITGLSAIAACSSPAPTPRNEGAPRVAGTVYVVKDTAIRGTFDADGVAEAVRQATLSTKLMGTVLAVLVKEGDAVSAGQLLVRIDARDLDAKKSQVAASIADAEASQRDAATQAGRIRALYVDSAATRAQFDAVETGLARANARVNAARASAAEVSAMHAYSSVTAPFAGIVTRRFVDPGSFAAPGSPLVTIQDGSQLRISASVTPDIGRNIRRGQVLRATVEGVTVPARVEGVVPATAGNLYSVHAIVANGSAPMLSGSTATLFIPQEERVTLVVPAKAVIRTGDLTGVTVRTTNGDQMRWVRLGQSLGNAVEITSGLHAGDRVVLQTGTAPPAGEAR
ncbi:MAG: efflux RND transporter periplasmic adaptor subunit [Gemmatimonadaceae bacterium]